MPTLLDVVRRSSIRRTVAAPRSRETSVATTVCEAREHTRADAFAQRCNRRPRNACVAARPLVMVFRLQTLRSPAPPALAGKAEGAGAHPAPPVQGGRG